MFETIIDTLPIIIDYWLLGEVFIFKIFPEKKNLPKRVFREIIFVQFISVEDCYCRKLLHHV